MELNWLAVNKGILILNKIAVIIYLSKGLKIKILILNIIKYP